MSRKTRLTWQGDVPPLGDIIREIEGYSFFRVSFDFVVRQRVARHRVEDVLFWAGRLYPVGQLTDRRNIELRTAGSGGLKWLEATD